MAAERLMTPALMARWMEGTDSVAVSLAGGKAWVASADLRRYLTNITTHMKASRAAVDAFNLLHQGRARVTLLIPVKMPLDAPVSCCVSSSAPSPHIASRRRRPSSRTSTAASSTPVGGGR